MAGRKKVKKYSVARKKALGTNARSLSLKAADDFSPITRKGASEVSAGIAFPFLADEEKLRNFINGLTLVFVFAAGLLCFFEKKYQMGFTLLVMALLLWKGHRYLKSLSPLTQFGLVVLGGLLVTESFSVVADYRMVLPQGLVFDTAPFSGSLFLLGCGLMYAGCLVLLKKPSMEDDWNPWVVRGGVLFLLGFSAFTTWVNLNIPNGYYCDDQDATIQIVMNFKELHSYYLIDGYGLKETGSDFLAAFLWYLFPDVTAFQMQRIAGEAMALASIWMMYLLGREVAGRRVGLLLAALCTFSKWMPAEVISGYFTVSATLAASWVLWAFFRLCRESSWMWFLNWSLAVSFGTYMYSAFRLFGIFMVALTFCGLVSSKRKGEMSAAGWTLASLGMFLAVAVFTLKNKFLSPSLIHFLSQTWVIAFFFSLVLGLAVVCLTHYVRYKKDEIVLKWVSSLSLIGLLIFPMISDPNYGARFALISPDTHATGMIGGLIARFWFTLRAHFMGEGVFGTSAFDLQTALLIVLGLICFLARPNWKGMLLWAGVWVGLAPHFIPDYTYNGRSATAIPSLFLISALGLEGLRRMGAGIWSPKSWNRFFVFLLLAFFGWQAFDDYQIIYQKQIYSKWLEALVSREVIQDSPSYRVYLTSFSYASSAQCQGIMDEGHPLYQFLDHNPIHLKSGETAKDVVVLVFSGDAQLKKTLEAQFPEAQWTPINFRSFHYPTASPDDSPVVFYKVLIKADELNLDFHKLIYLAPNPKARWTRDFYCGPEGPLHSCIYAEDDTELLRMPFPFPVAINAATFYGVLNAPVDGVYEFSTKTRSNVRVAIGTHRVINLEGNGSENLSAQKKQFLKKGYYPVRYDLYFRDGNVIPDIQVKEPGAENSLEIDSLPH